MSLIRWEVVDKKNMPLYMNKVLIELNNRLSATESGGSAEGSDAGISTSLYAECLLNMLVFRRLLHAKPASKEGIEVMSRIRAMNKKLKKVKVVSAGWPAFTQMSRLSKISESKFSLPKIRKTVLELMSYDELRVCLDELKNDNMVVPRSLEVVKNIASKLGFQSPSDMIAYVRAPLDTSKFAASPDKWIEEAKAPIIHSSAPSPQDIEMAKAFSPVLIAALTSFLVIKGFGLLTPKQPAKKPAEQLAEKKSDTDK